MTLKYLPHGWATTTTRDLFEFVSSGSRGWAEHYSDSGAKFIRIGNLDHGTIELDLREIQHVRLPDAVEGTRTRLREGDILISITAELGMIAVVPHEFGEAYVNQHVALARPRLAAVEPRFIAWFLASDAHGKKQLLELRRGATKVGLGLEDIRQVEVALPPLVEQGRIVAKIEALTAKSRRAKKALDAVPGLLEAFRQSVLAAAFRGDLTADWRERNSVVEPAEELLRRIRAERRRRWEEAELAKMRAKGKVPGDNRWKDKYEEPARVDASELPELPEGWTWGTATEVCDNVVDCHNKTAPYEAMGVRLLRTSNIRNGELLLDDARYVSEATYAFWSRRCPPMAGDVLFTREAPMGEAAMVPAGLKVCMGQRMMLLRANKAAISPDYLLLAAQNPYIHTWAKQLAVGTGVKHLRVGDVERLPLPICSLGEQSEVVRRVRGILSVTKSLHALLKQARVDNEALDRAILAKALRGELVPQDPNDEPASVLLERLRAEREEALATQNGRSKAKPRTRKNASKLTEP